VIEPQPLLAGVDHAALQAAATNVRQLVLSRVYDEIELQLGQIESEETRGSTKNNAAAHKKVLTGIIGSNNPYITSTKLIHWFEKSVAACKTRADLARFLRDLLENWNDRLKEHGNLQPSEESGSSAAPLSARELRAARRQKN
jgi:hypothetical protein